MDGELPAHSSARRFALAPTLSLTLTLAFIASLFIPSVAKSMSPGNTISDLPGWDADDPAAALSVWQRSCAVIVANPQPRHTESWLKACRLALELPAPAGTTEARRYFEDNFTALPVRNDERATGLFTGYFEPLLDAAKIRSPDYPVPILGPPEALVSLAGKPPAPGLAEEASHALNRAGTLVAAPDRAAIETGALNDETEPFAWLASPVDAFFLHVQGSGRLRFDDESTLRVAYAGKNGHPYTSIGKLLVDRGEMSRDEVSMQSLRVWLEADPERGVALMRENRSYIFFRAVPEDGPEYDPALGPVGQQGIPLTAGRSLAVDLAHHAPGALLWLETDIPGPGGVGSERFRRLMVAQDTGSAIRGPVRGDIFFGSGDEAGARAGRMQAEGRLIALIPRS